MNGYIAQFILITAFCFITTGCFEKIVERKPDPGVETSEEAVAKALNDAIADISIFDAHPEQWVSYEDNYRIETNPVIKTFQTDRRLTSIENTGEATLFSMLQNWYEFNTSGEVIDETHTQVALSIPHNNEFAATMNRFKTLALSPQVDDENPCDGRDVTDDEGRVYDCIKYFNLRYEVREEVPPRRVANRPGCEGLPNCRMTVRYLSYDEVKWRQGTVVHKINLTAEIAPQIPDLFYGAENGSVPLLSLCLSGLFYVPEAERNYHVRQCKVLRDFDL